MSAADDRAVVAALRDGHSGAAAVRAAAGLSAAAFKGAVQRLRYQGKVQWDSLQLTPSMIEIQDVAPPPPGKAPVPADPFPFGGEAGDGEDAGAMPPSAPASEPVSLPGARLLSAPEQLLRDIEAWCGRTGTAESKLGAVALRHPGFVPLLRKRLTAKPDTIAKVRGVIEAHAEGLEGVTAPPNNICVPKGLSSESAARAIAQAKLQEIAGIAEAHRGSLSTVAQEVALEAKATADRRKAARTIGGNAGASLALPSDASPVEIVTTVLAETVDDAAKAMARRWPKTWAKVLNAARAAEERPGQMLIRLIEMGLAQVEAPRG